MIQLIILLTLSPTLDVKAQLIENSKIFLTFKDIEGETNVNGDDALNMLKSYIVGKTNCVIVASKNEADFIFELSVIEKNMGNRGGKINITEVITGNTVFDSGWQKGASTAFYGYSGTRAVIGKIIKDHITVKFPQISK